MRTTICAAAVLALLAPPASMAGAQPRSDSASLVNVGDLVQLRGRPADARSAGSECEGRVATAGDTLVIEGAATNRLCPRWVYAPGTVAQLRVARGRRGSRLAHAGIGALVGAAVGAGLAYAAVGTDDCTDSSCDDIRYALAIFGGGTFGTIGALIGALLPAGPRWVTVPVGGPVRIAGLTAQPAVRVGSAGGPMRTPAGFR